MRTVSERGRLSRLSKIPALKRFPVDENHRNGYIVRIRSSVEETVNKNVGGTERTVRIAVGLVLLAAFIGVGIFAEMETTTKGVVMAVLLILAAIPLASAGAQKCPMNSALGRNTYTGSEE
jgi:hypothetical protein